MEYASHRIARSGAAMNSAVFASSLSRNANSAFTPSVSASSAPAMMTTTTDRSLTAQLHEDEVFSANYEF
jgi:hypothetical protein